MGARQLCGSVVKPLRECFSTLTSLLVENQSLALLMEKAEDIHVGETKKVRLMEKTEDSSKGQVTKRIIKGQRGISLRACVAKAAGWTLEKANAAQAKEATINKQSDSK